MKMKTVLALLLAIVFTSPAFAQKKQTKPKTKAKAAKKAPSTKSSTPKAKKSSTKVKSSTKKTTTPKSKTTSSSKAKSKSTSKASAKPSTSKSSSKATSSAAKKTTRPAGKKGPSKSKPWQSEATPALQKKAAGQVKRMKSGDRTKLLNLLNKGKTEDILMMEGIGQAKVKHLLKGRPYKKVEDAINITGIGEKLFANMLKHAKKPKLIGLAPKPKAKTTK